MLVSNVASVFGCSGKNLNFAPAKKPILIRRTVFLQAPREDSPHRGRGSAVQTPRQSVYAPSLPSSPMHFSESVRMMNENKLRMGVIVDRRTVVVSISGWTTAHRARKHHPALTIWMTVAPTTETLWSFSGVFRPPKRRNILSWHTTN